MRQAIVREPGGPIEMVEVETPEVLEGQALVRVRAIGVNYIDHYHRTGFYKMPLPIHLGLEGAGEVVAIGPGVTDVAVGDRVAWAAVPGSYATHALADASKLVPVPTSVSFEQAAACMLQGMTAHSLTHDTFPIHPHHTCLVHAAAGGVGLLLCQMAKKRGARVIGVVSTPEKEALASDAGADHLIVGRGVDFVAEARRLTDGRGVDVVYDSVGKDTFDGSLASLRVRGMLVTFGQASGPIPPFDVLRLGAAGSLYMTRAILSHYTASRSDLVARASWVLDGVGSGALRLRIDRTLPLEEAQSALDLLTSRATAGKVLLAP